MKNGQRLLCMAILAGACAGTAFAEEHRLSLPDALRLALDNSLLLQAQDVQVAAKRRSKDFAWSSFIPRAGVTGTLSRMNAAPTNPFSALEGVSGIPAEATADPAHTWNIGLGLSAQLDISLALFDGIRHTVLDYEAGLISRKAAEAGLIRDVKKSYYNLVVLQESRKILEQSVETARKHFEQAQRNYRTGIGSEFEVLSAQVGWESLKPSLEELRVGYQSAELAFKQLLGLKRADTLSLTDPLQATAVEVDAQALIRDRVAERLDIQALRQAIAMQKNAYKAERNLAYTPILSLRFSVDPAFLGDPFRDPWFEDVRDTWSQQSGMLAISLTLPLDGLLPFSSSGVRLANLDARITELEKRLALSVQGAELEIESLVMQLDKARAALAARELNVRLAEKAYAMAEKGFATGALKRLDLDDADDELMNARHQVLKEKYSYITTLVDLEYAVNQALLK